MQGVNGTAATPQSHGILERDGVLRGRPIWYRPFSLQWGIQFQYKANGREGLVRSFPMNYERMALLRFQTYGFGVRIDKLGQSDQICHWNGRNARLRCDGDTRPCKERGSLGIQEIQGNENVSDLLYRHNKLFPRLRWSA